MTIEYKAPRSNLPANDEYRETRLPVAGEGLSSERMSPLGTLPEDFSSEPISMGRTAWGSEKELVPTIDIGESLPERVSAAEVFQRQQEYRTSGNSGEDNYAGPEPSGKRPRFENGGDDWP